MEPDVVGSAALVSAKGAASFQSAQKDVDSALDGCHHAIDLLTRMLDLNKLDSGKLV